MRYRIFRDHMGKFHFVRLSDEVVLERYRFIVGMLAVGAIWIVAAVIAAGII